MKKYIILLILLTSCASRQVDVNKTNARKDSVSVTDVSLVVKENKEKKDSTNIKINTETDEITITPIDSSEGIIVEGKNYKNVIIKLKRNKTNTSYANSSKETINTLKDSIATNKTTTKEVIENKTKEVNRGTRYYLIFWLFLLILILYLLWRNRQQLVKFLPLK
jgi:hypothetical protein